jgi:hypothetical protein
MDLPIWQISFIAQAAPSGHPPGGAAADRRFRRRASNDRVGDASDVHNPRLNPA